MPLEYFQSCYQTRQTKVVLRQPYQHQDGDSGEFDSFKSKLVNKLNFS